MDTKFCPDCRQELPTSAFTKNKRMRDGLAFYCAPCARARVVASRRRRLGEPRTRHLIKTEEPPPGFKWCAECGEVKPLSEFPRNRSNKSGYQSYCKPCHNRITRENKDKHGGARNYHLRRRYGITAEHADAMLAEQGGLCAICREAPAAHIDHDHVTGRVRGILCFNCNGALGQFRDRTDLMMRAVTYLQSAPVTIFAEPPSPIVGFVVGPMHDPRPADEPRWPEPPEYVDDPAA